MNVLKKDFDIAVVSGSDLNKIKEQLGSENIFEKYKYIFAENGLVAFRDGNLLPSQVFDKSSVYQLYYIYRRFNIFIDNSKYDRRRCTTRCNKFLIKIYIGT